jgi:hypothetical protein
MWSLIVQLQSWHKKSRFNFQNPCSCCVFIWQVLDCFMFFFFYSRGCVHASLPVPRLIPTDLEVNDQVSLQWPSILATLELELETTGKQTLWSRALIIESATRWLIILILAMRKQKSWTSTKCLSFLCMFLIIENLCDHFMFK